MSANPEIDKWIEGTWLAVSHQTITVVDYRSDGTFSSTYFTPSADLKTCLEGSWHIDTDILRTRYLKSVPPAMQVPMDDEDRIERISDNRFKAHGQRGNIVLTFERVAFKKRSEVYPGWHIPGESAARPELPSVDELRSMTEDQFHAQNPLSKYIFATIDIAPVTSYELKSRYAIENALTEAAANYYLVTAFIGMWGNGGMQHVLLCELDEVQHKRWELQRTVQAFKYYGCERTAEFLMGLIPKAAAWSMEIGELNAREGIGEIVPESEFEKIWSEVDKYDAPFDKGFPGDPDVYEAMLRDMRQNPGKYLER